jgi:hypothetical protein
MKERAGGYLIQTIACLTRAATRSTPGKIGLAVFDQHGEDQTGPWPHPALCF